MVIGVRVDSLGSEGYPRLEPSTDRRQYIIALAVTAGGALRFPTISAPVPSKSNKAEPSLWSMSMR